MPSPAGEGVGGAEGGGDGVGEEEGEPEGLRVPVGGREGGGDAEGERVGGAAVGVARRELGGEGVGEPLDVKNAVRDTKGEAEAPGEGEGGAEKEGASLALPGAVLRVGVALLLSRAEGVPPEGDGVAVGGAEGDNGGEAVGVAVPQPLGARVAEPKPGDPLAAAEALRVRGGDRVVEGEYEDRREGGGEGVSVKAALGEGGSEREARGEGDALVDGVGVGGGVGVCEGCGEREREGEVEAEGDTRAVWLGGAEPSGVAVAAPPVAVAPPGPPAVGDALEDTEGEGERERGDGVAVGVPSPFEGDTVGVAGAGERLPVKEGTAGVGVLPPRTEGEPAGEGDVVGTATEGVAIGEAEGPLEGEGAPLGEPVEVNEGGAEGSAVPEAEEEVLRGAEGAGEAVSVGGEVTVPLPDMVRVAPPPSDRLGVGVAVARAREGVARSGPLGVGEPEPVGGASDAEGCAVFEGVSLGKPEKRGEGVGVDEALPPPPEALVVAEAVGVLPRASDAEGVPDAEADREGAGVGEKEPVEEWERKGVAVGFPVWVGRGEGEAVVSAVGEGNALGEGVGDAESVAEGHEVKVWEGVDDPPHAVAVPPRAVVWEPVGDAVGAWEGEGGGERLLPALLPLPQMLLVGARVGLAHPDGALESEGGAVGDTVRLLPGSVGVGGREGVAVRDAGGVGDGEGNVVPELAGDAVAGAVAVGAAPLELPLGDAEGERGGEGEREGRGECDGGRVGSGDAEEEGEAVPLLERVGEGAGEGEPPAGGEALGCGEGDTEGAPEREGEGAGLEEALGVGVGAPPEAEGGALAVPAVEGVAVAEGVGEGGAERVPLPLREGEPDAEAQRVTEEHPVEEGEGAGERVSVGGAEAVGAAVRVGVSEGSALGEGEAPPLRVARAGLGVVVPVAARGGVGLSAGEALGKEAVGGGESEESGVNEGVGDAPGEGEVPPEALGVVLPAPVDECVRLMAPVPLALRVRHADWLAQPVAVAEAEAQLEDERVTSGERDAEGLAEGQRLGAGDAEVLCVGRAEGLALGERLLPAAREAVGSKGEGVALPLSVGRAVALSAGEALPGALALTLSDGERVSRGEGEPVEEREGEGDADGESEPRAEGEALPVAQPVAVGNALREAHALMHALGEPEGEGVRVPPTVGVSSPVRDVDAEGEGVPVAVSVGVGVPVGGGEVEAVRDPVAQGVTVADLTGEAEAVAVPRTERVPLGEPLGLPE